MTGRAALYARISFDRSGEAIGVDRQLHDLRALADTRGWRVVAELSDNDISASKGQERPGYEQVWQLVRSGQVDHVVVWQTSRFVRSRADRARVITEFGKLGVDVVAAQGPSLDLRSAYGRGVADLMTTFDTMESEVKSERVAAAIADNARRGKAWGMVPFGWDRTNGVQTINEDEAAIVRELVDRLLAGEALSALREDMNRRDVPSPGWASWHKLPEDRRKQLLANKEREAPPRTWGSATIRALVRRDANAAIRKRTGDTTVPGAWPAIIEKAKHDKILAMMTSPERRTHTGPRPGARKHLLSYGIGVCGVCGGRLRWVLRQGRKTTQPIYQCTPKGCTGRRVDYVDNMVGRVVVARLGEPDALSRVLGSDTTAKAASDKFDELQRRLDEAADSQADGKITIGQLERITARLSPELEAARRERDAAVRAIDVDVLRLLAGPQASQQWAAMPVAAKRAALETLGVEVVINPRQLHGPGFEADSIEIRWKN
ncbi:recombinase family protein [Mycobacterium sp. OTB74]|jgi:DNA invertase Pin-like site-specific DNA recombinase|uniref:recombinase family protein n=1 Tax=Mycobacterium sp. OTB74 TaxID=1853452 RepID=UPI0024738582|nr:recombinase family protein [Mycobacterium sp. OTB74]MDH6242522.1 site-specific DNA recombinase [Mycobacterium sp. OTB74]